MTMARPCHLSSVGFCTCRREGEGGGGEGAAMGGALSVHVVI